MSTSTAKPLVVTRDTVDTVNTWAEFRTAWQRRQNFALGKEIFPYHFESPPLADVIDTIRRHPQARILTGRPGDSTAGFINRRYPEFLELPKEEAATARVQLSHFEMLEFTQPGQLFAGLEQLFEAWYAGLREHGFQWSRSQRAFFLSGPDCHTNYHFDASYVLAWQIVGVKRFCWLKDPERWCGPAVRQRESERYEDMSRPSGLTPDDWIEFEMHPGDVLWNVMQTPHWVYSPDETSYSLNITHFDLTCDGQLSPINHELHAIRRERGAADVAEGTKR